MVKKSFYSEGNFFLDYESRKIINFNFLKKVIYPSMDFTERSATIINCYIQNLRSEGVVSIMPATT